MNYSASSLAKVEPGGQALCSSLKALGHLLVGRFEGSMLEASAKQKILSVSQAKIWICKSVFFTISI